MSKRTKRKLRAPEARQPDLAVTAQPKSKTPASAQEAQPRTEVSGTINCQVELGRCEVTGRTEVVRSTVTLGRLTIR